MKYTTAKTILKIYRKEGRFGKKKQRLKKGYARLNSESLSGFPQEKPASIGGSTHSNVCAQSDQGREEGSRSPQMTLESTLCPSFWGTKITEHFI
jgi:hypothetical protein